jgi:asparagine synthase (glutamine-hydrolysing)
MCGFAGVVVWEERFRVSRETLERMGLAVAHRGPDDSGLHITREAAPITPEAPQVGMAFRRLSILDPDPRSNQPFTDGRHWLVFNGEIYNFRELREELERLDPAYAWRTSGDTEVLLRSYAVWGEKCVEHLNGMFAFAVWDEQERTLFLARDRMGQKPLYVATPYCASNVPSIAFASEIGAIRKLPWFSTDLEDDALCQYLRYGCIGDESTIFSGVEKLAPGMWRSFQQGSGNGDYYFFPNDAASPAGDAVAETRRLVSRAVERQLVSDVPLGVFLSGGVDSSIVAACARRCGQVETFSIGFDDAGFDETAYAEQVAGHLGTKHHAFKVTPRAGEDLPRLAEVFGEPFADSSALPTHYLARETRQHVKVALSGDGGDELFGGYDRYRAMQIGSRLGFLSLMSGMGRMVARGHPKARLTRAGRLLASLGLAPAQRYDSYLRLFDDAAITALWRAPRKIAAIELTFGAELQRCGDPVRAAAATDRILYLPDDLLTKLDRASMLHALEVRSPFMDHELVQFAAGLTTDQLLRGGPKRMLREAFSRDLPDFVFRRKKMGFAVPIGEWFRGELRPMLHDNLFASNSFASQHFQMPVVRRLVDEHEQSRVDHSQRLYALLMLELWWNTMR